jgi:hypothetical protein
MKLQSIQPVALGVFYHAVPSFLDMRGALAVALAKALDDPAAAFGVNVSASGPALLSEEVFLDSKARKCRLSVSPVKLMLLPSGMDYKEYEDLANRTKSALADIFKDVRISYIGAMLKTTLAPDGGQSGDSRMKIDLSPLGMKLEDVVESTTTTLAGQYRRHTIVKLLAPSTLEITFDLQKIEGATWKDVATMPTQAKGELSALVDSITA